MCPESFGHLYGETLKKIYVWGVLHCHPELWYNGKYECINEELIAPFPTADKNVNGGSHDIGCNSKHHGELHSTLMLLP